MRNPVIPRVTNNFLMFSVTMENYIFACNEESNTLLKLHNRAKKHVGGYQIEFLSEIIKLQYFTMQIKR